MCISPAERYSDHKEACWEHHCLVSGGKRIVLQHQRKHQEREPGYLENDLVVTWLGSSVVVASVVGLAEREYEPALLLFGPGLMTILSYSELSQFSDLTEN